MSHARILRHPLLRALRRQGGQRHCDKLQRHAEKLQHKSDGEHTHLRIDITIQLCCRHAAKTENSEYEKRRRLHLQSSPLRFEALFSGCQNSALKSQEPKQFKNEKIGDTCRAEPRFPRDLVTRSSNDRALRRSPLAGPRAVSERLSRGKGYFRGKPKIASMRNGRDCDLQSRPLRFEALIFGLPLKKGQLKATSSVIMIMKPAITPHVPRCG